MSDDHAPFELRYSSTQPGVENAWSVDPMYAVAHWDVEVLRLDEEDDKRRIGTVLVAVCDLTKDIDWFDVGDAEGGDLFDTCMSLLFTAAGELRPELDDQYYCDRLLLLDHMTLEEGERGKGLGPTVARLILERLGSSSTLAAAFPQPDGWEDMSSEELTRTRTKIERTWASVGFAPFREGLWLRIPEGNI